MSPARQPAFPFSRGYQWMAQGIGLLREQALRLLLMGLILQLLAGATQYGPFGILFVLAVPALSAGMLQAVHLAHRGSNPAALTLFAPFTDPGRLLTLFVLGLLLLAITILAVAWALTGAIQQLDPAVLERLQSGDPGSLAKLDPAVVERAVIGLAAGVLVGSCLAYFSIPLVWFHRLGIGRAIFDGLAGLFRQWRAFLVLSLLLGLVSLPVAFLAGYALTSVAVGGKPSLLVSLLTLVGMVGFQVLVFTTQYFAFIDVFPILRKRRREESKSQLVA